MNDDATPEPAASGPSSPKKRRVGLWVGIGIACVVVLGAAAAWFFFFRSDAPPPVSSESATSIIAEGGVAQGGEPGEIDGKWNLDQTIGTIDDFSSSFAGYRIDEQLASIGANTAAGRTPDVSGSLDVSGASVTNVDVTVDMTTLESDDRRRDGQMRKRGLQTDEFPTATFKAAGPVTLDTKPADGISYSQTVAGELTLHGVTKQIEVPVSAQLLSNVIVITGSFEVALADYDIEPPTGLSVVSVADTGEIEFQLFFTHA